jgi:hypothetical protein
LLLIQTIFLACTKASNQNNYKLQEQLISIFDLNTAAVAPQLMISEAISEKFREIIARNKLILMMIILSKAVIL